MRLVSVTIFLLLFTNAFSQKHDYVLIGHFQEFIKGPANHPLIHQLVSWKKGDIIFAENFHPDIFIVDSVIKGNFIGPTGKILKAPFEIKIFRINEATVFKEKAEIIIYPSKLPAWNTFYLESTKQFSSKKRLDVLKKEFSKNYKQNLGIFNSDSNQKKFDIINNLPKNDLRYVSQFIDLLGRKDTIDYPQRVDWDGVDKNGRGVGGYHIYLEKAILADFVLQWLRQIPLPSKPQKKDKEAWQLWWNEIRKDEFLLQEAIVYNSPVKELYENNLQDFSYNASSKKITTYKLYNSDRKLQIDMKTDSLYEFLGQYRYRIFEHWPEDEEYFPLAGINKIEIYKRTDRDPLLVTSKDMPEWNTDPGGFWGGVKLYPYKNNWLCLWYEKINDQAMEYRCGIIDKNGDWVLKPKTIYTNNYPKEWGWFREDVVVNGESIFILLNTHENLLSKNKPDIPGLFLVKFDATMNLVDYVNVNKNTGSAEVRWPSMLQNGEQFFISYELNYKRYYTLLDKGLTIKVNRQAGGDRNDYKPVASNKGYLMAWQESPNFENLLKSVLIDTAGKVSEPVNVYKHSGWIETVHTFIVDDVAYFYIIDNYLRKLLVKKIPLSAYVFSKN